jgi:zinc protease
MVGYKEYFLDNGLQVLIHEDDSTEIAVLNILYKVGSRDEEEQKTGFAHLFEHLMFGGSKNVKDFDAALQKVGGESNAFTTTDITNYYITIPAVNLETAFWLESDRMLGLNIDPEVLDVQRKVVVEEFKQRYLNQPYGDAWLKLRPLAYHVHPYKWATIGKELSHIENATLDDVKDFFSTYYTPNNAILVIAGNVKTEDALKMAQKWFGSINKGTQVARNLPVEPAQVQERRLIVEADVPLKAIYKIYHMPSRLADDYHACDLLSDILGRGNSSRLYEKLVKRKRLFNSISAYVTGSIDPGLFVISGKMNDGVDVEQAEQEIENLIVELQNSIVSPGELEKVKNQAESTLVFSEMEVLNRSMNLAYAAMLGDPEKINKEKEMITRVMAESIKEMAEKVLRMSNSSTLCYLPENGRA